MADYTVKSQILHNKKLYKPGSTITLTDAEARSCAPALDLPAPARKPVAGNTKQINPGAAETGADKGAGKK